MSDFMRENMSTLRLDQGMVFLQRTVGVATLAVRCGDLVRVNGEGKLLWSVMNVEDTVSIEPETSEVCTTRQVLLETSTNKKT